MSGFWAMWTPGRPPLVGSALELQGERNSATLAARAACRRRRRRSRRQWRAGNPAAATAAVAALSTTLSTAALDKHPQSRERGITLDLGFSSFTVHWRSGWKHFTPSRFQFPRSVTGGGAMARQAASQQGAIAIETAASPEPDVPASASPGAWRRCQRRPTSPLRGLTKCSSLLSTAPAMHP